MAEFVGGDMVVVPFPLTDLQSSKRRSAGTLTPPKLAELVERVCAVIRAGGDA